MILSPNKIYERFRNAAIDESKTVDSLITLIETIDNDEIRKKSIKILNKIDISNNKIFKLLENIFLSDPNEDLRYAAARVIKKKFLNKALSPFLWGLKFESSYNCLVCIINSLEKIHDDKIKAVLLNEIKKIMIEPFKESLSPLILNGEIESFTQRKLADILLNHITIFSLKKKFKKLNYEVDRGLVVSLDLSNVEELGIDWHNREFLEDTSDILGIKHLKELNNLKFFPLSWTVNDDRTFTNSLALLKALENLNNKAAKKVIISEIEKTDELKFVRSVRNLITKKDSLENLSVSKLSNIYRNFILISFLKRKYKEIDYKLSEGEVIKLRIEGKPLITLPEFICHFRSLRSLELMNCNLYSLPDSIGAFKELKVLNVKGNNLTSLPKSIKRLRSLRNLDLSNNKFAVLPTCIGRITSLRTLNLESNKLVTLPKSIGRLILLKHLNISKNQLKYIPCSIGELKFLHSLTLNSNKIEKVPESISLLHSLKTLNLNKNLLREIPVGIGSLFSLKVLKLEENTLESLPNSIKFLKSLEWLNISWNRFKCFPLSITSLQRLKNSGFFS
jgi:hypothetical protein